MHDDAWGQYLTEETAVFLSINKEQTPVDDCTLDNVSYHKRCIMHVSCLIFYLRDKSAVRQNLI